MMQIPYFCFTFILLTISFKTWIVGCKCHNVSCNPSDLKALISFSNCIGSGIDGWNSSILNCCTWPGVTCDEHSSISSKRVVKLELGSKGLKGKICKSLEGLDQLRFLNLSRNELMGSIPLSLCRCSNLQVLDLSWNYLDGSIPSWIGNFKYLVYLNFSRNFFNGEMPESLTALQSLTDGNIWLEGPMPVKNHKNTLDVSYNMFTGQISPSFGNLKRIQVLNLKQNRLSGCIPDSLSRMTSLQFLDLSLNHLSGEIPRSLEGLRFLSEFNVSYNQLCGTIPTGGRFTTFPYSSYEGNECQYDGVSYSCQSAQIPAVESPTEKMTIMGWPFGIGATTFFVVTVSFCFLSGWAYPNTETRKTSPASFWQQR